MFLSFAVLILWVSDTEIDRPQKSAGKPPPSHNYHLVAVKRDFKISLYDGKTLLKSYPIAIGKHPGDKMKVGDMRTPEGNFYIEEIQDSRAWVHDFQDGKGPIRGAYGPWFLRLGTGADRTRSGKAWSGIAIHGTHDPDSIGALATEGCVRMHGADIEELKKLVKVGTPVSIVP